MALTISADLVPTGGGAWPTHSDIWGKGGYRAALDNTARDAITTLRRSEGMLVYVIGTGNTYRLGAGLTNADWVLQSSGAITAGNGLTGTTSLSVLPNGGTLNVSPSGVKVATSGITGNELAAASVDLSSAKVTGVLPGSMVNPDFVAQTIKTTDHIELGAGTISATGSIRGNNAFSIWGRNTLGGVDTGLLSWDGTIPALTLGGNGGGITSYCQCVNGSFRIGVGTNISMSVNTTAIVPALNKIEWQAAVVTAPFLGQADNTSGVGGQVGQTMTQRAQSCTASAGGSGGNYDIGPGAGLGAGGRGRLLSGGAAPGAGVARFAWNDTGWATDGVTPIAQPARVGQLGDATTGVAGGSIGDVGAVFNQSILNNMHKTFLDKFNLIEAMLHNRGISA